MKQTGWKHVDEYSLDGVVGLIHKVAGPMCDHLCTLSNLREGTLGVP